MSTVIEVDKEVDVECPTCKNHFDLKVKQKKPKVEIQENTTTEIQEAEKPKPEIKIQKVIESMKPGYSCPDGNCGAIHKNKNYTQRPKGKCNNCSQFDRKESGKCPWCKEGEIEAIDSDELDDLGIPNPEMETHNHGDT